MSPVDNKIQWVSGEFNANYQDDDNMAAVTITPGTAEKTTEAMDGVEMIPTVATHSANVDTDLTLDSHQNGNVTNGISLHRDNDSTFDASDEKPQSDARKHKQPLVWCKWIINRPKMMFSIMLCLNLSFPVLTILLILCGETVFPTVFNDLPLQLTDDDQWLRYVAWNARNDEFTKYNHNVTTTGASGFRTSMENPIYILYEKPNGNVFTKENLQAMRDLEDVLISKSNYTDFCQLDAGGECKKPVSLVRYFDGTYAAFGSIFNDTEFDNIPAVLDAANSSPFLKSAIQFHFSKDTVIDVANGIAESPITRSIIPFGWPLEGYTNVEKMEAVQADFITSTYNSYFQNLFSNGYRQMNIIYHSGPLWQATLDHQVTIDTILVAGSFVFIFCFVWFQTGSLWIAGFAVLGIMTSFCSANLFYRYILDFRFFGTFHILSIFIILGIGADDIFVFMDTWKSTGFEVYPGLEYRLSDAYRRASITMLVTSLTTAIAFFVSATSPLLGVKTFGIFAGILVLSNYVTVITFLPTVIITYHNTWYTCTWCCFRPCMKTIPPAESKEELNVDNGKKKNLVVRFFMGPYFRFVTHKVYRWFILVFFAGVIATFIYFATTIGPQEEPVQVFREGSNFVEFSEKNNMAFTSISSNEASNVNIVWGLQNQDLSSCHHTDYECTGTTVWDNSFDLNPTPSQKALKDFCARLRNLTEDESDRLHVRRDIVTGEVEVNCFIDDMYNFYDNLNLTAYPNGVDVSMPLSERKMLSLMENNPAIFDTSQLHETFYRYFETGLGYWLTKGYTGMANADNEAYRDVIGEERDRWDTQTILPGTDEFGTKLRYAAFSVKTNLLLGTLGYKEGIDIVNAWEDFVNAEMAKMPPSVSNGFQCTCESFNLFHWVKVQKSLSDSAVRGVIFGIAFAFPLLVIATSNIILGTLATISIALTTGCVIGVIPLAGWKLGLLESLNLSLIVGLAVDYVVHLAEGYHLSKKDDRLGRLNDMLEHVGVSIVSGAATTLGASAFMLFAKILFFMQFGIFMFCTIGFSMLFSLGLFTTVLGLIGPEGQTGSLVVIYHWIIGRNKSDIECTTCDGKGFHSPITLRKPSLHSVAVSPFTTPVRQRILATKSTQISPQPGM